MRRFSFIASTCILMISLTTVTGCSLLGSRPEPTPTIASPAIVDLRVIADGTLLPNEFIHLGFLSSGEVVAVLVEEGDEVAAGAPLATLGNAETLLAEREAVALELLIAQQALDDLILLADLDRHGASQSVLDARLAVVAAQAALDNFDQEAHEEDLEEAQDRTADRKNDLDEALAALDEVKDLPEGSRRREERQEDVDEARVDYNKAIAKQERLMVRLEQLELNLAASQAQLAVAQAEVADRQNGPDADAKARLEANIAALESHLQALNANLENLTLSAPFAGTVAAIELQPGETVQAGLPVITIADFSRWVVETDDLLELEVGGIEEGDRVSLVPEAMPEEALGGVVTHIDQVPSNRLGDVIYTVRIELEPTELPLRWGMSVTAYFEE